MAHVLRSKKTVKLKDLESLRGNRTKKSARQNETSDDPDFVVKGLTFVMPRRKRKQDMRQRCFINSTKRRRTETSEDLDFQVRYD
jgi:hypothetical protein